MKRWLFLVLLAIAAPAQAVFISNTYVGGYEPKGINISGTDAYVNASYSSAASQELTFSFWFKASTEQTVYLTNNSEVTVSPLADTIYFRFLNTELTPGYAVEATASCSISDSAWNHVAISFNLANASQRSVICNNAASTTTWTTYNTSQSLFLGSSNNIGNFSGSINITLAEYYLNVGAGARVDLTDTVTKRKLITADGKPGFIGGDGALLTGSQPLFYLSRREADAESVFRTNRGSVNKTFAPNIAATVAADNTDIGL